MVIVLVELSCSSGVPMLWYVDDPVLLLAPPVEEEAVGWWTPAWEPLPTYVSYL